MAMPDADRLLEALAGGAAERGRALDELCRARAAPDAAVLRALADIGSGAADPDSRFQARQALAHLRTLGGRAGEARGESAPDAVAGKVADRAAFAESLRTAPGPVKLLLLAEVPRVPDPLLAAALAAAMSAESDPHVLAQMVAVLKEIGSEADEVTLKQFLRHPDDRVCANTVEALVSLSRGLAIDSLLPLLARDDNRLRANLLIALRDRCEQQVTAYVRRMLKSPRFSFRASGLYCARHMDHGDLYPDVLALIAAETHESVLTAAFQWITEFAPADRARQDLDALAAHKPELAKALAPIAARFQSRGATAPAAREARQPGGPRPQPASISGAVRVPSRERQRLASRPGNTSSAAIPVPPRASLAPRRALAVVLGGLVLVTGLAAVFSRPADTARPRGRPVAADAAKERAHARPLRATVVAVGPDATLGPDEVALLVNGLLGTLRWPQAERPPVVRGTPLILTGARLVTEGGKPPHVATDAVHVATAMDGP